MTCLLTREDYRRWERWFNGVAQQAMPAHYSIRDYVSPYGKDHKPLWPDPPPRKDKPEKKQAPEMDDAALQQREEEIGLLLEERAERRREKEARQQALRRTRQKVSDSAKRLADMWERAEKASLKEPVSENAERLEEMWRRAESRSKDEEPLT